MGSAYNPRTTYAPVSGSRRRTGASFNGASRDSCKIKPVEVPFGSDDELELELELDELEEFGGGGVGSSLVTSIG